MNKLCSMAAATGLCGTAVLLESTTAQGLPPSASANRLSLIPAPAWTATNALPQPGVYRAEPYKMLVLVPGAQVDEKMVVAPHGAPRILQLAPEVQLVPLTPR